MKKKIIGIFVCMMLLVITVVPLTTALDVENDKIADNQASNIDREIYTLCYIEASGYVSEIDWPRVIGSNMWKTTWFRPFNDDRAIVTYWQIVYDSSVDISIYDKEGGELLWEHSDLFHEQIRIIGYYGIYIPSRPDIEKPLHIDISGNALVVLRTAR